MDIDLDDLLAPVLLLTHAAIFLLGYGTRAYRSRLKRKRYRAPLR
jgi:hypothetical protein